MRVGVFHDDCGDPGGANSYRVHLSALLRDAGHEVVLFTYRAGDEERDDPSVTVFDPPGPRIVGGRIPQHYRPSVAVFRAVRRWLRATRPDVLHIHTNHAFMTSVLMACRGHVPAVQTVHDFRMVCPTQRGVTPDGRLCGGGVSGACVGDRCLSRKRLLLEEALRLYYRPIMRLSLHTLIAPSLALRDAFEREHLPVIHIPHWADTAADEPGPVDPSNETVLFVGYLHYSKGVGLLLLAFREVLRARPTARLVIAGGGPMMAELRRQHDELGLGTAGTGRDAADAVGGDAGSGTAAVGREAGGADRDAGGANRDAGNPVTFLGSISEAEVAEWYRRCAFVVLPSIIYENSPLTIYEAMAAGRAVVATRIGGIPELVVEGETGLLFERNDPADLAAQILTLLHDPERAALMGRAGRRRAETEYAVERHVAAVLEAYDAARDAMGRGGSGGVGVAIPVARRAPGVAIA